MRRALDGNPPITTYHGEPGWGYFGKHAGYDYGIVNWTAKAPEKVTVINVWTGRETVDGGNIVEMQGQYTHRFLHMKSISVKVGDVLAEGTPVGITGNTGNVGYHLHHDVRKNGTKWTDSYANYVDWEQLIKQGENMSRDAVTKSELTELHQAILFGNPGELYLNAYTGKPLQTVITDLRASNNTIRANVEKQFADGAKVPELTKQIADLKSQLAVQSEDTQLLNGFGEFLRKLITRLGLK